MMSTFNAQNKAVRDKMMCVNEFIRAAKLPKPLAKLVRGASTHSDQNCGVHSLPKDLFYIISGLLLFR